jgi:flagellar hook-associated protein 1 FlgK
MYGINVGLEIGKRALLAQQFSLNVTGHNIANVNTPGFARQQAVLSSTLPLLSAQGSFGTGVDVTNIRRLKSVFLDQQYRDESQTLGKWQSLSQSWGQVERIYTEPSDTGFSATLDNFWNSWQDLAADPESEAARVAVKEQASLVINSLHQFSNQLSDFRQSLDDDIVKTMDTINGIANQLAGLNESIASAELTGQPANDLRDRRDYLIDQLSSYVNVNTIEGNNGQFRVYIGSMALVDGNQTNLLTTDVTEQGTTVVHNLKFVGSSATPEITNGQLAGLIQARDEVVGDRQKELDQLALALVDKVNEYHRQGYGSDGETGHNFFDADTTGAADIKLDDLIDQNDSFVAASLNGEIGDNSNALRIAGLRGELIMNGKTATFGDYYNSVVGIVGVRTSEAENMSTNQETLVYHIEDSRQSIEGVSLDEEMTNMVKYQHAYEAAARVITAMDEALNTIINGMGIVGR